MNALTRASLALALSAIALLAGAVPVTANTSGTGLVISQVYGGGGNVGAPYANDFVELFNPSSAAISLAGMSVQYASATGTGNFAANAVVTLTGSLGPGQHYLVQQASGGANGVALPAPDATGTVNMSGTAGKVIVASTTTGLACNGGSTPCSSAQLGQIVDLVGYGNSNFFEGSAAAPTLSNTTVALRASNGCTDTDSNGSDFAAAAPAPRNTASAATPCTVPTNPSGTGAATPAAVTPGGSTLLTVAVTPGANPASTGLAATADLGAIGGSATQQLFDDGTHGDVAAGDGTFSLATTVPLAAAPGPKTLPVTITDAQARSRAASIALSVTGPSTSSLVVSQVYGGGDNAGAPLTNDFVELFNRSGSPVSLAGASVQYAAATGATWQVTALPAATLQPGQHFLVLESGGANGAAPPAGDATGTIAMSATAGKIALVGSATALAGACPAGTFDLVGYGATASCFEGSGPAPAPSNTTADLRADAGCVDTDVNAADFATGAPNPRNTASPVHLCGGPTAVGAASPPSVPAGGSTLLTVTVTPGTGPASTGLAVACDLTAIGGSATQALVDDGTDGDATAGDDVFSFAATAGASPGATSLPCAVSDAQGRSNAVAIALTVEGPLLAIHDIQGAAHVSPHAGEVVSTNGIVTARSTNGFWIQDPTPDASDATSEGVFVFTSSAAAVAVGDAAHVNGRVQEFRPGGTDPTNGNLTTTELSSPTVTVLSGGNPLPPPVVVGAGGRVPPNQTIEDDATGSVETSGVFDPASDGLDFWESLEGMRVQVNSPVAVGPTNSFGETQAVGDGGAGALVRTPRGGLLARPGGFNPERVVIDDLLLPTPTMNVGDHYLGPVVGVLDYNFGNFFLEATSLPPVAHDGVTPETTAAAAADQLAVATFNVENLAPTDPQSKFDRLAGLIVHNLAAPDVISVEEVQDNSGGTDNGVVVADQTLAKLVAAISAAGGPAYDWRELDPVNDQDGGQPGGNIRQVFLFRTDRGLAFVDRPGGTSTAPVSVVGTGAATQLSFSPGRIAPGDAAWTASRKPLAGEFTFHGHHLFVIANHLNSKLGDDPLMGRFQPPSFPSEVQRGQQAQLVHDFVAQIVAADPTADVVVDGDLNDFEFSNTVTTLKGSILHDLIETLPVDERYSYVFEGNSETLDHVLVSGDLLARPFVFDVVHVNAEFADQASDHDPSVVRLTLDDPPTVSANRPYAVDEGGSVAVSASGTDPEGGPVSFAWDLDGNGTFETPGQSVAFSAASIDGPATRTIRVRATDDGGNSSVGTATVTIRNVPPSATFTAPASVLAGFPFALSLSGATDPSAADTAAGFTYAFDCGAGYGPFGAATSATCPTSIAGTLGVGGEVRDKDGGVGEYRATVVVAPSARSTIEAVLAQVEALEAGAGKPDAGKLDRAADALAKALDPTLWADPAHVDPKDGGKVFDRLKEAAQPLADLLKNKKSAVPDTTLEAMLDDLAGAARMLAATEIDDAAAAGAPADRLAKARDDLAKGDAALAKGDASQAIDRYRTAWQEAGDALRTP